MNPFDAPPSTPPVSYEPPTSPKRRGRFVVAAVATAGLLGVGAVGVSALSSDDDPELTSDPTTTDGARDGTDGGRGATTTIASETDDGEDAPEPGDDRGSLRVDGEILDGDMTFTIDTGDGDPITVDLGDLDDESLRRFQECAGLPMFDFDFDFGQLPPGGDLDTWLDDQLGELDLGELPIDGDLEAWLQEMLDRFGAGELDLGELPAEGDLEAWLQEMLDRFGAGELDLGELDLGEGAMTWGGSHGPMTGVFEIPPFGAVDDTVTVLGPDGPTIIDLGDGDGSVTIARDADTGEVTITTEGTASEIDLGDVLDGLPHLDQRLDQMLPFDADRIQSCLDELNQDDASG